jgi:hypothetical protein
MVRTRRSGSLLQGGSGRLPPAQAMRLPNASCVPAPWPVSSWMAVAMPCWPPTPMTACVIRSCISMLRRSTRLALRSSASRAMAELAASARERGTRMACDGLQELPLALGRLVSPSRHEAVRRAAGTVSVERYRLPVFELKAPLDIGAGLRLTRMDVEPFPVDDAVEAHAHTAVRWLAGTEGFCSTLLLVDRNTGHSIGETIWLPQALAASRGVRVDTVASMAA